MTLSLDQLPFHTPAQIEDLRGDAGLCQRLAELGMVPGAIVHVQRTAPLGDPLEIHLEGSALSVRKKDAAAIHVVVVDTTATVETI